MWTLRLNQQTFDVPNHTPKAQSSKLGFSSPLFNEHFFLYACSELAESGENARLLEDFVGRYRESELFKSLLHEVDDYADAQRYVGQLLPPQLPISIESIMSNQFPPLPSPPLLLKTISVAQRR